MVCRAVRVRDSSAATVVGLEVCRSRLGAVVIATHGAVGGQLSGDGAWCSVAQRDGRGGQPASQPASGARPSSRNGVPSVFRLVRYFTSGTAVRRPAGRPPVGKIERLREERRKTSASASNTVRTVQKHRARGRKAGEKHRRPV